MKSTTPATAKDDISPSPLFVGMFDVLGFKQIILNTPLDEVCQRYGRLRQVADWSGEAPEFSSAGVRRWRTPFLIGSDSIFLWADDEPEAVNAFFRTCAELMKEALGLGWPLRGGVGFGEAVMDRVSGTFLGPALVHANEAEKIQNWIGAALHPSCFGAPKSGQALASFEEIVAWEVPVKASSLVLDRAPMWTDRCYDAVADLQTLRATAGVSAKQKYSNAIAFAKAFP